MVRKKDGKTGNIQVKDALSIITAAVVHEEIVEAYKSSDIVEIDLTDVTDCDTAGIQLLYSLKKSCMNDGKKLIVKNPSTAVEDALNRMSIPLNTFV